MKRTGLLVFLCLSSAVAAAPTRVERWYDHAVIYEIYPRSFEDTNGDGIGDLNGITRRLDYLKGLGVDAIWVTPFFPSPNKDFGYDISDYENVAREYGTLADWDRLVAEANKRGIRVLIDFVLNHTSDQHPWFKESRSSRTNPKQDWYVWRDGGGPDKPPTHWTSIFHGITWTWDPRRKQWYYHIFLPEQPDLNWNNQQVRNAMYDVARFWLKRGASGFRLDATPYLFEDPAFPEDPHPPKPGQGAALEPYNAGLAKGSEVLRELRAVLNQFPGDPVLVGESLTANIQSLARLYGTKQDEMQLPMDFLFANLKTLDAAQFKKQVDAAESELGGGTPVFLLSNHDRVRAWDTFGDKKHNEQIAKLTAALTLSQRGAVLLYYGEEIGMSTMPPSELKTIPLTAKRPQADARDGERTPMQWDAGKNAGFTTGSPWLPLAKDAKVNVAGEEKNPNSMYHWYAALLKLRHENAAFRDGDYVPLQSGNPKVFVFGRRTERNEWALIALNMSDAAQKTTVSGMPGEFPKLSRVLLASPATANPPASREFELAPFGVMIAGS
ncbi:MAG TPA: alpha-glucosidase [Bryobacteraceae bacterium]|nr:alpha-glucosidase [Bryobacteraceae bacterium]